jgi:enterochelin esterase family protein
MQALPVIERIAAPRWLTPEALDARRAAEEPFPIVDGDTCTFAHCGEVIGVRLMHFGVGLPDDLAFTPLGESDWSVLALRMPAGSRLEYKLEITDSFGTRLVDDPLNTQAAAHPFGLNSVCVAAGYRTPDWARHDPAVATGRIVEHTIESAALGRTASASVYLPAAFGADAAARHPLLVVHDGDDYLRYAGAATVLDNLVAAGALPPLVAAFIQPGERLVEYADDPRHHRHLVDELVPDLEAELPLRGDAEGRTLMGCSFGAVASLSTAAAAPGFFGKLLLQSGSFAGAGQGCRPRPERLWRPVRDFVHRFLSAPAAVSSRVAITCGAYESLICENRAMVPVLEGTGMEVQVMEQLDGHNWTCWRDSLGVALPWLFTAGG